MNILKYIRNLIVAFFPRKKGRKNSTADTSAVETEIDKAVYKLYNLTPDEVKIIEGKK